MNHGSIDKTDAQPQTAAAKPVVGRLRDRLKEQTQAAILEAAEHVLAEEGLAQARIDAIAAQAGVSVGTLYNYFGDRDGIVRAVIQHNKLQILEAIQAIVDRPGPTFAEDLHRTFESFSVHCARHGRFVAVVMNANPAEMVCRGEHLEMVADLRRITVQLMARGVRDGVIRDEPELFGDLFLTLVRAFLVRRVAVVQGHPLTPHALVDFFLHGAGAPR